MQKNVASQKWIVFAFDLTDNTPKTGDAGNITANLRIDGGAANAVDDTNPAELEDGFYIFDITQTESNGDLILIAPASSTSNIQVIGVPGAVYTTPPNFPALGIESDGDLTKVNDLNGHTAQTGDNYARLGAPAGASVSADVAAIDTVVDSILVDTDTTIPALIAALNDPTAVAIADEVLKRGVSNVEGTADTTSLAAVILAVLESSISGTTWTIRKTGGATFVTKTVTVDATADPITGVT